jgi:hypothetical protein
LLSKENDLRFKAKMPIKIARHFILDAIYTDEKQGGMSEKMVKKNLTMLEKILRDKKLREDFFSKVKSRGKIAEDLADIFTDQHFSNSFLLYDIITESSYNKLLFFNADYIDNKNRYKNIIKEDSIPDLNLAAFIDRISDPFRYSLNEEVVDKNLSKLKSDIDLAIKLSNRITDEELADKSREKIIYALVEPDLLNKKKARKLVKKIHGTELKEKLISYIESSKTKIERAVERAKSFSVRNIKREEKKLRPEDREKFEKELQNIEATHRVSYNVFPEFVLKIFKNGRIKTVWDRGLSWHDAGNRKNRNAAEKNFGIRATGSKNDRHPISGGLYAKNGHDEKYGVAPLFGSVFLLLKNDRIKNRTIFTDGDSFINAAENNSNINRDDYCFDWESAKRLKAVKEASKFINSENNIIHRYINYKLYIEAIILGGVMLKDIESINFRANEEIIHSPEFEEIKNLAEKHKIKINIIEV